MFLGFNSMVSAVVGVVDAMLVGRFAESVGDDVDDEVKRAGIGGSEVGRAVGSVVIAATGDAMLWS